MSAVKLKEINESQHGKSFKNTKICNISFTGDVEHGCFEFLDMGNVDFSGAELDNVHFKFCDLRGVNFDGTKFIDVGFYKCLFDTIDTPDSVEIVQFYKDGIRVYWDAMLTRRGYVGTFNSHGIHYPVETDGEELTGYKKVCVGELVSDLHYAVAKLRIPAYAERIVYKDDKCRASCAQVMDIYDEFEQHYDTGTPVYFSKGGCKYNRGHIVYADCFDDNSFVVCSNGIHFFLTEQEAWDYFG